MAFKKVMHSCNGTASTHIEGKSKSWDFDVRERGGVPVKVS